jgi:hypothetical protein
MVIVVRLGAEGEGGMGEEEEVAFKLGAGASIWQMDAASGPVIVALAEAGRMQGASTLGN